MVTSAPLGCVHAVETRGRGVGNGQYGGDLDPVGDRLSRAAADGCHHLVGGQGRPGRGDVRRAGRRHRGRGHHRRRRRAGAAATRSPTWPPATSAPTRRSPTSSGACGRASTSSRRRCTRSTTPRSAPPEWVERLTAAAEEGGATLLVSGVDPGWGNDALAVTAASLCTRINTITCQEIFDYSTYNQPFAVQGVVWFRRLDGRDPDDAAAVHPDDGVGRQHPAHRPRAGPGDRRDHRGGRAAARSRRPSTP